MDILYFKQALPAASSPTGEVKDKAELTENRLNKH